MFGSKYKALTTVEEKGRFAAPVFAALLPKWMGGAPLATIEAEFGTKPHRLGYCEKAREFVLRIVPELAYLYGLLPQIYSMLFPVEPLLPAAVATIGAAVREGVNMPEKVALRQVRRRLNRVAIHREFAAIAPHLAASAPREPFARVFDRVRNAVEVYDLLNS